MNKHILILILSFYSEAFAIDACPANALAPTGLEIPVDFGDKLGCHLVIDPKEKYSPVACDEYKRCAGTLKFSPEEITKKRKYSMMAIALAHGKKLLDMESKIIENFKFHDEIKINLEKNFKNEVGSLKLCDNMLSYVETDKCNKAVMDDILPEELKNFDKNQKGDSKPLHELIAPILKLNLSDLNTEEKFLHSKEYEKIMEIVNANTVLRYMDKKDVKDFLLNIYRIKPTMSLLQQATDRKTLIKTEVFSFGGKIAKTFCEKNTIDNMQKQCEDFTRISRGLKPVDDEDKISSEHLSAIYADEKPAADLFTNVYRCEVFDIKPESKFTADNANPKNRSCKEKNRHNLLGRLLCVVGKAGGDQPSMTEIGKIYSNDVASATFDSIKDKNLSDIGASISKSLSDTKSSFAEVTKQFGDQASQNTANNPSAANNYIPQQSTVTNQTQTFAAPPIPPIPPSAAAVGVDNVFATNTSKNENMNSSELDKISAKLSDTENKLQELQAKTQAAENENLTTQIATKEKEIKDLKSAQQTVPSENATSFSSVIAAKEAAIGNIAEAQVQKPIAAEELNHASGIARAPTAAIAKAAGNPATDISSSAATSTIEIVELPKGIEIPRGGDPQGEAKFLEFVRAQFNSNIASNSFKINDPFKGEVEVIKTIAEDGKVNYVLRPLTKKDKKEVAGKKVEPKVNRAPAADEKAHVHKKDMDAILNKSATKGE